MAKMELTEVKVASYLAGPDADQPCVQLTFPGCAQHRMPADAALHLAARLINAVRFAEAGGEADIPHEPNNLPWIRTVFALGVNALDDLKKKIDEKLAEGTGGVSSNQECAPDSKQRKED